MDPIDWADVRQAEPDFNVTADPTLNLANTAIWDSDSPPTLSPGKQACINLGTSNFSYIRPRGQKTD